VQDKEDAALALERWADLEQLQRAYPIFNDFLIDVIEGFMQFKCSDIQEDIGYWLANGPKYRMVQAQRGQAKTTETAIYAVWRLIHDPSTRILIVSAGGDVAVEIANWIIQIIQGMPELKCLRPDRAAGDRVAVTAFDVHHSLKGPEKSPSIACIGITANMQGRRADVLIADDIESSKNSRTQNNRALLVHLTKDFVSINSSGDIIYLGTPQSVDSVYNSLPNRGVAIRIWPGRYPTQVELKNYGGYLAPLLLERIQADPSLQSGGGPTGMRGKVTDPVLLNEETLTSKEIDQGAAYFDLQHMLSTQLSDEDKFPLKLGNIRFIGFDRQAKLGPMFLNFVKSDRNSFALPEGFPIQEKVYSVQEASEFGAITGYHMYVDPAGGGQNGDELAYAVTGYLAGRVMLVDCGGMKGGIEDAQLDWLTDIAQQWKPFKIDIEKNFGNGAFSAVWQPRLAKVHKTEVEDVWETGQKELRVIDVLEPIISSGKFVVYQDLIHEDWQRCQKYPAEKRSTYSMFWQLARMTRERDALIHDDRLDAVAGSARHWIANLQISDEIARAAARRAQYAKLMKDPLGNGRPLPGPVGKQFHSPNALNRFGLGRSTR
jgi:hypothetical protein